MLRELSLRAQSMRREMINIFLFCGACFRPQWSYFFVYLEDSFFFFCYLYILAMDHLTLNLLISNVVT